MPAILRLHASIAHVTSKFCLTCHRRYTSTITDSQNTSLNQWIEKQTGGGLSYSEVDCISPSKVRDLHHTLPATTHNEIGEGNPLPYGQHLVFFHHAEREEQLSQDQSDSRYSPPDPFIRRMWAGGSFSWSKARSLRIGESYAVKNEIIKVEKKAFDTIFPKLFVHRKLTYTSLGEKDAPVVEELRNHVYLLKNTKSHQVPDLPRPDFSFSWTPTSTTLFRFSALTFNAHLIHLDRGYAQEEGYAERLVHGPLTALMLLEVLRLKYPNMPLESFAYRAYNPVFVNRRQKIHCATHPDGNSVTLWAVDEDGVVGMTGEAKVVSNCT